jgi:hypothetical protein
MVDQILEDGRIENRLRSKRLPRYGGANHSEDSRAYNSADSKRRQRQRPQRFLQPMLRFFRVRNQLVNGLLGEELAGQKGLLKRDASIDPKNNSDAA